jgi:tetratricopeptide (TPR) repeat protein
MRLMEDLPKLTLTVQSNRDAMAVVRSSAEAVLDATVHNHVTDHKITHSDRVARQVSKLLGCMTEELSELEKVVLLAAIYLHDIGMQTTVHLGGDLSVNPPDMKDLAHIRENHHIYSRELIINSVHPTEPHNMELGLIPFKRYANLIAEVAENHRQRCDINLVDEDGYGLDVRLRLLTALIQMGDCLDLDYNRVWIDRLKYYTVPDRSLLFWCGHHYVQSVSITAGNQIKITFAFPESFQSKPDYTQIITGHIMQEVGGQFDSVYSHLAQHGLMLHKDIDYRVIFQPDAVFSPLVGELEAIVRLHDSEARPNKAYQYQLPDQNYSFSGRSEELDGIAKHLARANVVTLTGGAGCGKSQIAYEYAHRSMMHDRIWRINCGSAIDLDRDYRMFLSHVGVVYDDREKPEQVQLRILSWFQAHPTLFIYENAEEFDLEDDLSKYLPSGNDLKGRILITTQDGVNAHGEVVPVDVFTLNDAEEFIMKQIGASDDVAVKGLANLLECHPLVLEMATAYIRANAHNYKTTADAIAAYMEGYGTKGIILPERYMQPRNYDKRVDKAWQMAVGLMHEQNEAAWQLVNLCAYCAPEDIPLALFTEGREQLQEPLKSALDPDAGDAYRELVNDATRYSLLKRTSPRGEPLLFFMHRCIQQVVRMGHEQDEDTSWLAGCLVAFFESLSYAMGTVEERAASQVKAPHIIQVASHADSSFEGKSEALAKTAHLYDWAGFWSYKLGQYHAALGWQDKALAIWQEVLDDGHQHIAISFYYIAMTHHAMGDYVASMSWYLKSYTALGDSHPNSTEVRNNMQRAYTAIKLPQPFDEWLAIRLAGLPQPDQPTLW